jgi:glyoxylase I family protein
MAEHSEADLLRQLELKLLNPDVRMNRDEVEPLLSDDFVEFGGSGRVFDKSTTADRLERDRPFARTMTAFRARFLTSHIALVTYRLSCSECSGPARESLRSSIWKRTGGVWRILFHQGTPCAD